MKRKKILVIALLCLILSGIPIPYAKAQAEEQNFQQNSVEQIYDEAIEELITTNKAVGVTAVFVRDGKVTLQKGYGYSDKAQKQKVDPSMSGFRIASISKTFVAIAAMKAEEDGKLDLRADITDYLEEDFPELQYPVTMEQLLTHSAGFEDLIAGIAVMKLSDIEPLSEVVRKYKPEQITKPGEAISYSNYGIALAAYVIEKATGIDFAEYCKDNIFIPLGMSQTSFRYDMNNLVYSKAFLPGGEEASEPFINIYPEGSIITTAEDMSKYLTWLLDDQELILQKRSKDKIFDRQFAMADQLNGIGYTWNIRSRNNQNYYEKKGESAHFYSRIVFYPSCNAGMFFSSNTYVPEEALNIIVEKVTDQLLGEQESAVQKQGATMKIEGSYINLRSSFHTAEKFLSYLIPDRMLRITGTLSKGYMLNGKKIIHIGNNAYDIPIGTIVFLERDGITFLATNHSQTYRKVGVLQSKGLAVVTVVLFGLSSLLCSIFLLVNRFRRKNIPRTSEAICLTQLLGFLILCGVLVIGLGNYAILSYGVLIRICSWSILVMTVLHIGFSKVIAIRSYQVKYLKYLHVHNVISLAFCLLMFQLNLF